MSDMVPAAQYNALLREVEGLRLWRGWEARARKAEAELERLQGLADHVVAACERQESPDAAMQEWIAAGWVRMTLQGSASVDLSDEEMNE